MTRPEARALAATLRRLFVTLFLRGRASRGLDKNRAPKSVASKLWLNIGLYALAGLLALVFRQQSVFVLSAGLHAMTFAFLGMYVAASGGEVLFNQDEADILLHRPIPARILLWAKARVLVEVSLWLAVALNLVGFVVGALHPEGGWRFVLAHTLSVSLEALFCTGCVVLVYQICLRWFGRERLEGLMTGAQVVMGVSAALAAQIVPRVLDRLPGQMDFASMSWWIGVLPPVWFAALDDLLTGHSRPGTWALAGVALMATTAVLATAFGKLAAGYQPEVATLRQVPVKRRQPGRVRRKWFDVVVNAPPLRWWLRDPVSRAAFLLTAAYLVRDRDVKLRVYPALASMLVMPVIAFFDRGGGEAGRSRFWFAFAGATVALIPALAVDLVRRSAQWRAADVFRVAPLAGPAPLCHGTRRALLLVLMVPAFCGCIAIGLLAGLGAADLLLMLPGLIAAPLLALLPCRGGNAVPFSVPNDDSAAAAGRFVTAIGLILVALVIAGLAEWARQAGWFGWLILGEAIVVASIYGVMRRSLAAVRWSSVE